MSVRRLLFTLLLLLTMSLPGLADRASAEFFSGRGDKALEAGKADEAEEHFRRAVQEDPDYAPARFGLARALIATERAAEGVAELKTSIQALATDPAWKSDLKKAQALLDDVDRAGRELRDLVRAHADDLVAFARRWVKKDEEVAVRALSQALSLDPGHAKAAELLVSLGYSPKGPPQAIFDGRSLDGWVEMGQAWSLGSSLIVGDAKDNAYIARSLRAYSGDFDVRMEARLVTSYDGPSYFSLCPTFDGKASHYSFGVLKGRFLFTEDRESGEDRDIYRGNPPNDFEPTDFHSYELRFRGNTVTAFVDGARVATDNDRPAARQSGFVGLTVQNCRFEIRRVEVTEW